MVYGISGVFLILLVIAVYMNRSAFYPRTWDYQKAFDREVERGIFDKDEFESYGFDEVSIKTEEGYSLYGRFYDFGFDDTVVIVHGWSYNLFGGIKYMNIFKEKGFNIMMYDHRNHGRSEGTRTTFGYKEKHDLVKVIDYVQERTKGLIGTHGESMGAATVLMHAAIDDRIDFVIADCPFASVHKEFRYRVWQDNKVPGITFLWLSSLLNFIRGGGLFGKIAPIKIINDIDAPVLFIHGEGDTFIPPIHSKLMYDERVKDKMLYLVPNAEHADAIQEDPIQYKEKVHSFLDKYNIKES